MYSFKAEFIQVDAMEWKEVIESVLKELNLTAAELAGRMGEQPARFYQFKSRDVKPGYEFLRKLQQSVPELSAHFLLTGEGPILQEGGTVFSASATDEKDIVIRVLAEKITQLEKQLQETQGVV